MLRWEVIIEQEKENIRQFSSMMENETDFLNYLIDSGG